MTDHSATAIPSGAHDHEAATGQGLEGYRYEDYRRDDILRMVPDDGRVIGSIGCAWGGTEAELIARGREVHGVDVWPEAIAVARTRLTSARVIAPEERHPFQNDSLDGLILADVLEHIPAAWSALVSYARAVRPGGWVIISVPNMRSINVLARFILLGDWPEKDMGIFDRTHIQVMSRKRLLRWTRGAGLNLERWYTRYQPASGFGRAFAVADQLTLRLFHEWFTYQLQGRFRKMRNEAS